MRHLLIFSLLSFAPQIAFGQSDCTEELKEIDESIASGKYPETNVQIAKQLRISMIQVCSLLDEETLAQMMAGIEDLLPTKSEEQRRADKKAKSEEAKADRKARKSAKLSSEPVERPVKENPVTVGKSTQLSTEPVENFIGLAPVIDTTVEFSASSFLDATNPGGIK